MMRPIMFFVLLLAIAWQNATAAGGDGWNNNANLLPQYCKDNAAGKGRFEKWRSTFGEAFIHMHHYCAGVSAEQKAKITLNQQERVRALQRVVSQMQYVSSSCNTRCVLYPELHTRWGWALSELGQVGEAVQHYQLALKAKRNYTLAYVRLSDLYLDLNQPDEARKILESGLKAKPDSRALKKRLKKLDSSE
jgi:tetratricopeptide (TPR) repeat protein